MPDDAAFALHQMPAVSVPRTAPAGQKETAVDTVDRSLVAAMLLDPLPEENQSAEFVPSSIRLPNDSLSEGSEVPAPTSPDTRPLDIVFARWP